MGNLLHSGTSPSVLEYEIQNHQERQGLYVEGNTRSQEASSFKILPVDHIQIFGLITCACLAFYFQLLKCWPRNPTAKPWTAGPSGSSHTSCEYQLDFQSQVALGHATCSPTIQLPT